MKLSISHKTTYAFEEPVAYALQQIRLTPKTREGQNVLDWSIDINGGTRQAEFDDYHNNKVILARLDEGAAQVEIFARGIVETNDITGIIGKHGGCAPLWYFERSTELTHAGKGVRALARDVKRDANNPVETLHRLSAAVRESIPWETGHTQSKTTAEESIEHGRGVCQDHAHVFLAAARMWKFPARYVSGYLMLNDRVEQDASHAWVEVHVEGLGWLGIDISNGISPDERYVPVATGLDYSECAPVSGMRFGTGEESMIVTLQVQQ